MSFHFRKQNKLVDTINSTGFKQLLFPMPEKVAELKAYLRSGLKIYTAGLNNHKINHSLCT